MKKLGIFLLLTVLIASCEKEKEELWSPPYDILELWNTHRETEWDSLSTANHLVGTWELVYYVCCGEGTTLTEENFEKDLFQVRFFEDGTLEVTEKDKVTQQSEWYVKSEGFGMYGIRVTPFVNQLFGQMVFGDNSVLFNNSILDGADNYFIKLD